MQLFRIATNVSVGMIMVDMEQLLKLIAIKHVLVINPRSVVDGGGTVFTKQVRGTFSALLG